MEDKNMKLLQSLVDRLKDLEDWEASIKGDLEDVQKDQWAIEEQYKELFSEAAIASYKKALGVV